MASPADINRWLDDLYEDEEYSHMIVKSDTSAWEDYPVYVSVGKNPREAAATGDKTMEVYSRNHTREAQMAEPQAFHYD